MKYQLRIIIFTFFVVFVFYNVLSSQEFSPLALGFFTRNEENSIGFVGKLIQSKQFPAETKQATAYLQETFGPTAADRLFSPFYERTRVIAGLEQALHTSNLPNPHIYYVLSVLYKEEKEPLKSEEYLQKATLYDPSYALELE